MDACPARKWITGEGGCRTRCASGCSARFRYGTGRIAHVGGRQLRDLLILLALEAGRVVPPGSLAGRIWPDEPPSNPGNALRRWFPGCEPNCARRAWIM
jgi:hypothetical protein